MIFGYIDPQVFCRETHPFPDDQSGLVSWLDPLEQEAQGKWSGAGGHIKEPSDVEKARDPRDSCLLQLFLLLNVCTPLNASHVSLQALGTQAPLLVGGDAILRFFCTIL